MRRNRSSYSFFQRALSLAFACVFILATVFPSVSLGQAGSLLPAGAGVLAPSSVFTPPLIIGLKVFPAKPFQFDFILQPGQEKIQEAELKNISQTLIKYFLTALTVPEDELWVNLSPSEQERMIPDALGMTEMGRDLLAQDYLLKQLTASFMFPDEKIGREFWKKMQARIAREYPGVDIPMETFHKVWIVPDRAELYQNGDSVVIGETHLKVMLEQDYVALQDAHGSLQNPVTDDGLAMNNEQPAMSKIGDEPSAMSDEQMKLQTDIIREVIIPALEKEVNEGRHFAQLRQIYYSMILATWYKRALRDSILGQAFADKNKIAGSQLEDLDTKEKIYDRYMQLFKDGVFDMIKEEYDPVSEQVIPRHYFSGGFMGQVGKTVRVFKNTRLWQLALTGIAAFIISAQVQAADVYGQEILERDELNIKMDLGDLPILPPAEMPELIAKLTSPDELVRLEAIEKLGDDIYSDRENVIVSLRPFLNDPNPALRRAAVEALGNIAEGHRETAEAVLALIRSEKDTDVLVDAVDALGKMTRGAGSGEVMPLVDLYDQTADKMLRRSIVDAVIEMGFINDRVIDMLKDAQSCKGLKRLGSGNARAMAVLAELAGSSEWHVHYYALEDLADFQVNQADATEALEKLHQAYREDQDRYGKRRQGIMRAVIHIGQGNPRSTEIFLDGLNDPVDDVVSLSIQGLMFQGYSSESEARKAVDALIAMQYDRGLGVSAVQEIGRNFSYAREALLSRLQDFEMLDVQRRNTRLPAVIRALGQMSPKNDPVILDILLKWLNQGNVFFESREAAVGLGAVARNNEPMALALINKARTLAQREFFYTGGHYLNAIVRIAPDSEQVLSFLDEVANSSRYDKESRERAARLLADLQNRDKVTLNTVNSFQDILAPSEWTETRHSHRVFVNEQGNLFIFDYKDLETQAQALDRIAVFVEKEGYAGKVLSDARRKALFPGPVYDGHDYPVAKIVEALNAYHQAGVTMDDLNAAEQKFVRDLILAQVIGYSEDSGYTVLKPGVYVISITQGTRYREKVLRHEVTHALVELDEDFRSQVTGRWNNLSEGEQDFVRTFLKFKGYDVDNDPDLLITEYAAYFQDGQLVVDILDNAYDENMGSSFKDEERQEQWRKLKAQYRMDGDKFVYHGEVDASLRGEAMEFLKREASGLSDLLDTRISTEGLDKEISEGKPEPGELSSGVSKKVGGVPIFRFSFYSTSVTGPVAQLREKVRNSADAGFRSSDVKRRALRALRLIPDGKQATITVSGENLLVVELDADGNPVVEKTKVDGQAEKQKEFLFKGLDYTTYVLRMGKDGKPERVVVDGGHVQEQYDRERARVEALVKEQERRLEQEQLDRLNRGPGKILRPGMEMKIDPNEVRVNPGYLINPNFNNDTNDPNDAAMLSRETVESWLGQVAVTMSGLERLLDSDDPFQAVVDAFEENPKMVFMIEQQLDLLEMRLRDHVSRGLIERSFVEIQQLVESGISLRTDAIEEDFNSDQPVAVRLVTIVDRFINLRPLAAEYGDEMLDIYDRLLLVGRKPIPGLVMARAEELRAQWETEMLNLAAPMLKVLWVQEFHQNSGVAIAAIDALADSINVGVPFLRDYYPSRVAAEKARAKAAGLIVEAFKILPEEMKRPLASSDSLKILFENYHYDFVSENGRQTSAVRAALEAMDEAIKIFATFGVAANNTIRRKTSALKGRLWRLLFLHVRRDFVTPDSFALKTITLLQRFQSLGLRHSSVPQHLGQPGDLNALRLGIIYDIESLKTQISETDQLPPEMKDGLLELVDADLDAALSMLRTNGADFAMLGINSPVVDLAVEGFANRGYVEKFWSMGFIQDPDALDGANLMNAARRIAALFRHDQPLSARAIYQTLVKSMEAFENAELDDRPGDGLPFIAGIVKVLADSAESISDDAFEQNAIADTVSRYVQRALQKMSDGEIQRLIEANQAGIRKEPALKGGIDLNADFLDLRIGGEPARPQIFSMNESFADRIGGLIPVIINITHVDNLPVFLMQ